MNAQDSADRNKATHIQKLKAMIPRLEDDSKVFLEFIKNNRFHSIESEMFGVLRELDRAEAQCKALEHKAAEYNRYQFTLDLQVTPFFNVEEARTQVNIRRALWHSLKNWGEMVEKWSKMPFKLIDVQDISDVS